MSSCCNKANGCPVCMPENYSESAKYCRDHQMTYVGECPYCRIAELESRLQYEKQDGDRYAERVGILEAEVERLRNLIEQHNAQEAVCHINMEKDDETV